MIAVWHSNFGGRKRSESLNDTSSRGRSTDQQGPSGFLTTTGISSSFLRGCIENSKHFSARWTLGCLEKLISGSESRMVAPAHQVYLTDQP